MAHEVARIISTLDQSVTASRTNQWRKMLLPCSGIHEREVWAGSSLPKGEQLKHPWSMPGRPAKAGSLGLLNSNPSFAQASLLPSLHSFMQGCSRKTYTRFELIQAEAAAKSPDLAALFGGSDIGGFHDAAESNVTSIL